MRFNKLFLQEFDDYRDADDAVYELNGRYLLGYRVVVEHARGLRRDNRGRDGDRRDRHDRKDRQDRKSPQVDNYCSSSKSRSESTNYIELDHKLKPGRINDIDNAVVLPGQTRKEEFENHRKPSTLNVHKYAFQQGHMKDLLQKIDQNPKEGKESKTSTESEIVAGSDIKDLYFDHDFGFFSAILACYNNHWVLKTSPDDWWNVIARNVAQHVDENGDKNKVRDFFVDHEGKKTIAIALPGRLDQVEYDWLFDQFSKAIRENIKTPGYVDKMEANFSTTTSNQLIASQIMLMSSLQKYFNFEESTRCGIPGVEMEGTKEDWQKLMDKTENLQKMLDPIMDEIGLRKWFKKTKIMLGKLLETFEGNPDVEWWSHILSWNETYGSGEREWWSGWIIDFLMAKPGESPKDFQSGVVSVPLTLIDENFGPPVEDTGTLIAGTVGFTVEEGPQAPIVQAKQGWALLLPKGSPVIARMNGTG